MVEDRVRRCLVSECGCCPSMDVTRDSPLVICAYAGESVVQEGYCIYEFPYNGKRKVPKDSDKS